MPSIIVCSLTSCDAEGFEPAAGRRVSQTLPLSTAYATFDATPSLTLRPTLLVLVAYATPVVLPTCTTSTSCATSRKTDWAWPPPTGTPSGVILTTLKPA
jgi:hypothetical protein